ncbi:hypothetical protein [Alistipes putredinis]|uniref:hypothetical protein n=1 Tax=Alistipes putredinis TaxID=28117 RepID=UPI00399572D7
MLKDRLDLIIKELGLSGRQFEKECGLPPGSYSSISDGVGANKLKQILIKYPQISLDWIIMGDGDMFKKNESQIEKIDKNSERIDKLLDIVASQQKTIELLAQKGAAADVQGVAGKAVQG